MAYWNQKEKDICIEHPDTTNWLFKWQNAKYMLIW